MGRHCWYKTVAANRNTKVKLQANANNLAANLYTIKIFYTIVKDFNPVTLLQTVRMRKFVLVFLLALTCQFVNATVYTVNSTSDASSGSGASGTLRYCITQANLSSGNTINFSTSGVFTISSQLPTITQPMTINGYSAPGAAQGTIASRTLSVQFVAATGFVFDIQASNVTICGISFVVPNNDVMIYSNAVQGASISNFWFWGNYVNTNLSGSSVYSSSATGYCFAVYGKTNATAPYASNVTGWVMGTNGDGTNDANEGNLVANSTPGGTYANLEPFRFFFCDNFTIAGNIFGLAADGVTPLQTYVNSSQNYCIASTNCTGFRIGTNGDGVSDNLERNVICGFRNVAIVFFGNRNGGTYFNDGQSNDINRPNGNHLIAGNYIGCDATGAVPSSTAANLKNAYGISLNGTTNSTVGSSVNSAKRNVIVNSLNYGVLVVGRYDYNSTQPFISKVDTISGNYIGVLADGVTAAGNKSSGIFIGGVTNLANSTDTSVCNLYIKNNIIANNGAAGINVKQTSTSRRIFDNTFTQNSIYNNTGLGINLASSTSDNGVTGNNGLLAATTASAAKPNLLANYGIITGCSLSGNTLSLSGYVGNTSAGNAAYANAVVEFFIASNSDGDQNGEIILGDGKTVAHGEGKTYLGSLTANGLGIFSGSIDVTGMGVTSSTVITNTATEQTAVGSTSEFGANVSLVTVSGNVYSDVNGLTDGIVNGTGTNAGGTLNAVLYDNTTGMVAAIAAVTAGGGFSFTTITGDSYTVYITTNTYTVGTATTPVALLPAEWKNTGENLGSGAGSDGTPNGVLSAGTASSNVANANFGIVQCPNGLSITASADKTVFCASSPSAVTLTSIASGGITPYAGYLWTGSGVSPTNTQNTSATPTAGGTYNVTVTDAVGCTATGTTASVTYDNTIPSVSPICTGTSLRLFENNGVSWLWTTTSGGRFYPDNTYSVSNDSDISHLQAPYIRVAGNYTVTIVDAVGCTSSATIPVSIASCSVLASNLTGLTVQRTGSTVALQWQAGNSAGIKEFIVERSTDGNNFITAGKVSAGSNSSYHFEDEVSMLGCIKLYYRIQETGTDNSSFTSDIVSLACNGNDPSQYVFNVYPNPVVGNSKLTINYSLPAGVSKAQIIITNILGAQLYSYSINNAGTGINSATLPVGNNMAPGAYFVRIVTDRWISKTVKIIK